jgi:hypothetical protein
VALRLASFDHYFKKLVTSTTTHQQMLKETPGRLA